MKIHSSLLALPVTALFVFSPFFSTVPKAEACSCAIRPLEQVIAESALIFAGVVTSVEADDSTGRGHIEFNVTNIWKGATEETLTLHGSGSSAACGWNPEVGQEYLVYAHEFEGELSTNLCNPNKLIVDASEDIVLLQDQTAPGTGTSTEEDTPSTEGDDTNYLPAIGILALLVIILVVLKTKLNL
jgi:hypothetical protein